MYTGAQCIGAHESISNTGCGDASGEQTGVVGGGSHREGGRRGGERCEQCSTIMCILWCTSRCHLGKVIFVLVSRFCFVHCTSLSLSRLPYTMNSLMQSLNTFCQRLLFDALDTISLSDGIPNSEDKRRRRLFCLETARVPPTLCAKEALMAAIV